MTNHQDPAPQRAIYQSPLGPFTLLATERGLGALRFDASAASGDHTASGVLAQAAQQLDAYFAGDRHEFDLPLDLDGTPFQQRVWAELREIPYGETTTYSALARAVGRPDAVRAVAACVGRTPVPIIVPCHRVIGVNGSLTGYGGGLPRKRALLDLESGVAELSAA